MVSVSVRHLFHKLMDEKIKTWTLRFPAKEKPSMERALFDWPIVLQYDVKAKDPLISRKFSPFVCCFCFVRAFSFQGHTKIALFKTKTQERTVCIESHEGCYKVSFLFC